MKAKITIQVPTGHQYRSISSFGIPVMNHPNGSYSACRYFDSENEAKEYLREVANRLAEDEKDLNKMLDQIESGYMRYDAATADIAIVDDTAGEEVR